MDPIFQTRKLCVAIARIFRYNWIPWPPQTLNPSAKISLRILNCTLTEFSITRSLVLFTRPSKTLSALRTGVSTTFFVTSNHSTSYVTAALRLFNLKNVNSFLTKIHAKANLINEAAILQKEITRLANAAAKTRKTRTALEKAASDKGAEIILVKCLALAELSEVVVARARVWKLVVHSPKCSHWRNHALDHRRAQSYCFKECCWRDLHQIKRPSIRSMSSLQ